MFDLGRELYERLTGLGGHVELVGKSLASAVSAYNRAVGALESRVLVTARKLNQLGVTDAELAAPPPVELPPRTLSAPELVPESAPGGGLRGAAAPGQIAGGFPRVVAPDQPAAIGESRSYGAVS